LAKIYTKTGDDGTTGMIGGKRILKDSPSIEACGALDELNSWIGILRCQQLPENVDRVLQYVQNDLFTFGQVLATPGDAERKIHIDEITVTHLENDIDFFESGLAPLKEFILPGGSHAGAELHFARTITRRAERNCVALMRSEKTDPLILKYLNRLSDLFFVLARSINQQQSIPENHPSIGNKPGA
jgi:cob(I)alamin adenosyltransferase